MSPYRCLPPSSPAPRKKPSWCDGEHVAVVSAFWLLSAARVVAGVLQHETFGAEATLALLVTILVPWVSVRARLGLRPSS